MIGYLQDHFQQTVDRFVTHAWLAVLPLVIGLVLAIPVGWLASRYRRLYPGVINLAGLLYTLPSVALFVIMPSIIHTKILSPVNVVVALTIYTVALLVRVIADALIAVPGDVRAAAVAMGFTGLGRFLRVDLPIAVPVIVAGLRVAAASNVGLVSVGALIGVDQLGSLFTEGFTLDVGSIVLLGILLCVLLALILDGVIVLVGRRLTTWQRAGA
ncbi:MAG: ABC transporter permease [Mycobacteriales bacterium]